VGRDAIDQLWIRGGFPPAFLADSDDASWDWRANYIRTFLERDLPALGIRVPALTIRRFWLMLAHYHGQAFNAAELGTSLGAAHTTVSRYLDVLAGTLMVRRLQPWFENISKRQIKTPKIYFRDSGLLHQLIGTPLMADLVVHPRLGASWEGFALEQIIRASGAADDEAYCWGVHNQAELDLLIVRRGRRLGYEVKYADAPRVTRSERMAMETLRLDALTIVVPGTAEYPAADGITVKGLARFASEPTPPVSTDDVSRIARRSRAGDEGRG
jgi:predicted AAA+ superfamily ATPase